MLAPNSVVSARRDLVHVHRGCVGGRMILFTYRGGSLSTSGNDRRLWLLDSIGGGRDGSLWIRLLLPLLLLLAVCPRPIVSWQPAPQPSYPPLFPAQPLKSGRARSPAPPATKCPRQTAARPPAPLSLACRREASHNTLPFLPRYSALLAPTNIFKKISKME